MIIKKSKCFSKQKDKITDFDINDYLKSIKDIQMLLDMVAEDDALNSF